VSIKREMFLTPCVLPALKASFFLAISFSTFSLFSFNCRQSKKGEGREEREREGEGGHTFMQQFSISHMQQGSEGK